MTTESLNFHRAVRRATFICGAGALTTCAFMCFLAHPVTVPEAYGHVMESADHACADQGVDIGVHASEHYVNTVSPRLTEQMSRAVMRYNIAVDYSGAVTDYPVRIDLDQIDTSDWCTVASSIMSLRRA